MYKITCMAAGEGQLSAEFLGEAHAMLYPSQASADAVASRLAASVTEVGLPGDTEYFIEWASDREEWDFRHAHGETCLYCGTQTLALADDAVLAEDDDDGWTRLGLDHEAACEWIETRAHRRTP